MVLFNMVLPSFVTLKVPGDLFDIKKVYGIIYEIKCLKNGKIYIGQTLSHGNCTDGSWKENGIIVRFVAHYQSSILGGVVNNTMYSDMRKYGIGEFVVKELVRIPGCEIHTADELEAEYISKVNKELLYNIRSSPSLSKSKKILYEYYDLSPKRSEAYNKRQERSLQISFKNEIELPFSKSEIQKINIIGINHSGKLSEVRAIVEANQKNKYRKCFNGPNIKTLIKRAQSFALNLADDDKITISAVLKSVLEEKDLVYEYQDKLDMMLGIKNIWSIRGYKHYHKGASNEVYSVVFRFKNKEVKRPVKHIMFGGKTTSATDSYEKALKFIKKFRKQYTQELEEKNISLLY